MLHQKNNNVGVFFFLIQGYPYDRKKPFSFLTCNMIVFILLQLCLIFYKTRSWKKIINAKEKNHAKKA